ncbi:SulP family inorganic anion transporter [Aliarcobacter cryaerophilus]|uniref:SulP family inorganic anion transporter n=1 Tax=Aliarcobacter cryaerophilus TaxID=28198 RepID=UPI0021B6C7D8|nr:SulP family inorganic anion transporter [Aliarcobacter cryaerophilus]MCT7485130.1 SulP family inorganic anion transporter [Aliarcobacter cryaerophilus]MCT7489700.1 SulP family inorganic anion transporter [Aliarcobacter cryaerophilus]
MTIRTLKNDILAGVTVAIVALPLALAFGVVSGAGAIAGLYGAIILGFIAALLGGVAVQVSGPTGPMTVVTAAAVATFSNDFSTVMAVVFFAGIIQISFGIVDLGKWIKFIPYPIISGFMCGIGVIIIILQINPLFGANTNSSIVYIVTNLFETFENINYEALFVGLVTIFIMFLTPKSVTKIVPAALIALFFVTILATILNLNISTIGEIPSKLPDFILPSFNILELSTVLTFAITLALLGSVDTQLTSVLVDSKLKTNHNSKKELIAQGIGNTMCSFFGAIPGAGATMRTVVNMKNGATTRISGVTHAIVLLIIALFLAPIASKIPLALLAGILIKVGFDILDYRFLQIIQKVSKDDLIIMITVFLLTVFVDLIIAVAAGVFISSFMAVYQISKNIKIKHYKVLINDENIDIIKVKGALFFATAILLERVINKANSKKTVIDCTEVSYLDISAIFKLEDIIEKYEEKSIEIILVIKYTHKRRLLKIGKIFNKIKIYRILEHAKIHLKEELENEQNISTK